MSQFTKALLGVCLIAVAGCSGVGNGNKPVSARIVQVPLDGSLPSDFTTRPARDARTFACTRSAFVLLVTFSDGSVGNFTSRARWTSADPSIADVSNGNTVSVNGRSLSFGFGSVGAKKTGFTTISAETIGLEASINVDVADTTGLRITPAGTRMAPRSFQAYTAQAELDGKWVDVSTSTVFSFVGDTDGNSDADATNPADLDNYGTFTVDSTGRTTLNALAASPALQVQGQLNVPGCSATISGGSTTATDQGAVVATAVQVSDIPTTLSAVSGLEISYEKGDGVDNAPGPNLVEGTSQLLRIVARFGDLDGNGSNNLANGDEDPNEIQDLTPVAGRSFFGVDTDGDGVCELAAEGAAQASRPSPIVAGSIFTGLSRVIAVADAAAAAGVCPGTNCPDDPLGTEDEDDFGAPVPPATALKHPAGQVCAIFGRVTNDDGSFSGGTVSNTLRINVIDKPLLSLATAAIPQAATVRPADDGCPATFDPSNPCIQAGTLLNFRAVGSFQDASEDATPGTDEDGTADEAPVPYQQVINSNVNWEVVDNDTTKTFAFIGPVSLSQTVALGAGQLFALTREPGDGPVDVTVKATFVRGLLDGTANDTAPDEVVMLPLRITPAATPQVNFALASSTTSESVRGSVVVTLSRPSANVITVPFTVSGNATQGADYTLGVTSPITFAAGVTQVDIPVLPVADSATEGDENLVLTLGTPTNAVLGTQATVHTRRIVDSSSTGGLAP